MGARDFATQYLSLSNSFLESNARPLCRVIKLGVGTISDSASNSSSCSPIILPSNSLLHEPTPHANCAVNHPGRVFLPNEGNANHLMLSSADGASWKLRRLPESHSKSEFSPSSYEDSDDEIQSEQSTKEQGLRVSQKSSAKNITPRLLKLLNFIGDDGLKSDQTSPMTDV